MVKTQYIVVCPDHGAAGPFTKEEAEKSARILNTDPDHITGCVYRVLPLFSSTE